MHGDELALKVRRQLGDGQPVGLTPLKPSPFIQAVMFGSVSYGGASPRNCARKMAGP
jgi:hypothetical protein